MKKLLWVMAGIVVLVALCASGAVQTAVDYEEGFRAGWNGSPPETMSIARLPGTPRYDVWITGWKSGSAVFQREVKRAMAEQGFTEALEQ